MLARRSRRGTFQPTVEGARTLAPFAKKKRSLKLQGRDALAVLDAARTPGRKKALALAELSDKAAARALALPPVPVLLLLQPAGDGGGTAALPVPARRLQSPAPALKLLLLHTAGLEYRPNAVLHSLRSALGDSS